MILFFIAVLWPHGCWLPLTLGPHCGSGDQLSLIVGSLWGNLAWLEHGQTTVISVHMRQTESDVATLKRGDYPDYGREDPRKKGSMM